MQHRPPVMFTRTTTRVHSPASGAGTRRRAGLSAGGGDAVRSGSAADTHRLPVLHRFVRLLAGLLVVLLLLLLLPLAAQAKTLRVVSDDNYPPYLFLNPDRVAEGYLVDLWKLWEQKTGIPVELAAIRWADAQQRVLTGDADVIDMIYRTPAREPKYDFSEPYADLPVAIYSSRSITGLHDVGSLKGFKVGVQEGDACIETLEKGGVTAMARYPNYEALIRAAMAGDVKIFCLDEYPANYYLYRLDPERQFRRAFVLYQGQFHRAVRKGDTRRSPPSSAAWRSSRTPSVRPCATSGSGHWRRPSLRPGCVTPDTSCSSRLACC